MYRVVYIFFFQAEDGIRDVAVTGVQTCALPILMLAVQAEGHEVTTIEGLAPDGEPLHAVQQAFHECHGLQCGFCTPGFVMSVVGLLAQHPHPTDEEMDEGIAGNLCRCTGYASIRRAVRRAAELSR